ncbi:MAG: cobyrinate a,c-diamide synthase, partial [Firmicutes bacterium]|nr:cobyrinate a,c-diamide synthase [Bacillota bacterium]
NLDMYLLDENTVKYLYAENSRLGDISVTEGVMGYYDGLSMTSTDASSYALSKTLGCPTVLVVNVKGMAMSVPALIKGFREFRPDSTVRGVILNGASEKTYGPLKEALLSEFGGAVKPLGYLPVMKDCSVGSRHLGLITADEIEDIKEKDIRLGRKALETIDMDGLLELAAEAGEIEYEDICPEPFSESVRIAVARDEAFCFYYEDGLDLLRKLGAEIVEFSPMRDETLPSGIHGLYLGGGYPELHLDKLCGNTSMLRSVKEAVEGGLPTIAECGGFMYIQESIAGSKVCGILPGASDNSGKLVRFGYAEMKALKDNVLLKAGDAIPVHEFHHWDSRSIGSDFSLVKPNCLSWNECVGTDTLYGGYPHFHLCSSTDAAKNFYEACLRYKNK